MRILIVEDEKRLAQLIEKSLKEEGFAVDTAFDGKKGEYFLDVNTGEYDLVILDLMLPEIGGIDICKNLRARGDKTPVLMLTAMSNVEDKVAGLDAGADDYLTKPFSFMELHARVQAVIRRSKKETSPILQAQDLILNPLDRSVTRGGSAVSLTPKEFAVLEFMLRNKGSVITRTMLIEHVWDYNFDSMSNVVDVFISNLRNKISKKDQPNVIETVHGVGYRIID